MGTSAVIYCVNVWFPRQEISRWIQQFQWVVFKRKFDEVVFGANVNELIDMVDSHFIEVPYVQLSYFVVELTWKRFEALGDF